MNFSTEEGKETDFLRDIVKVLRNFLGSCLDIPTVSALGLHSREMEFPYG